MKHWLYNDRNRAQDAAAAATVATEKARADT